MHLWSALDHLLARIRPHREPLSLLIDGTVVFLAWQAVYLFRLGFERWISARPSYDLAVSACLVLVYLGVLWLLKVPKGVWRFSGFGEVQRIAAACLIAGLVGATAVLMFQLSKVPRSVLALHPVFVVVGLAMVRMAYRMLYEQLLAQQRARDGSLRRALVLGAGDAGRLLLAGIQHQGWTVAAFLDDNPAKHNTRIAGVPVLGGLSDVARLAQELDATHVIVAMPSATPEQRRRALDLVGRAARPVLTVPSPSEIEAGRRVEQLRDVELTDLLGRSPTKLDERGLAEALRGQVVCITGAGGSIGSELCRQIARYQPSCLLLFELSESALYLIEQELASKHPGLVTVALVGDVKDDARFLELLQSYRPRWLFHAAAFKHVPMMERENAWMALSNNAIGTYRAAQAAAQAGVAQFVLVSTDKAINPTNVMGASKRLAELMVSALAAEFAGTRFVTVRFGNVLGSSGSVVPKFKVQIASGGPVTVTHPDIIRYFMTIPEAVRLVLQAGLLGASGQVLLLDMGEPVRILDMARELIRLSGHTEEEIPIVFTGLRPGEKLFEELLADSDTTMPTENAHLHMARLAPGPGVAALKSWMEEVQAARRFDDTFVRDQLKRWVPEFQSTAPVDLSLQTL